MKSCFDRTFTRSVNRTLLLLSSSNERFQFCSTANFYERLIMVLCWNSLRKCTRRENKEFHLQNSFHWSMELLFWNCVRLSFIRTAANQRCLRFLELSIICGKNYKIKWEDDSICSFFSCFSHEKKTKRLQNERANCVFCEQGKW